MFIYSRIFYLCTLKKNAYLSLHLLSFSVSKYILVVHMLNEERDRQCYKRFHPAPGRQF